VNEKSLTLLLLLLAGGLLLTYGASSGVFFLDQMVASGLAGEKNPGLERLMAAVSIPGNGWAPLLLIAAATAFLASVKKYIEALFLVSATLGGIFIAGVLKEVIGRPRPPGFFVEPDWLFPSMNQFGYPSGHVLFFMVSFGMLAFFAWKFLCGPVRWACLVSCLTLIVLIGPSRVYLGAHWVSDVIGSVIIGALWLTLMILMYQAVLKRMNRKKLFIPEVG
jgi:membrane-associated phospholipid phosphatase